jgi:hypothetical protein
VSPGRLLLPRTIRLDDSDERVFPRAAGPEEWAVSGAFAFAGVHDPEGLDAKGRQAFVRGFLGTASFGWSTFVAVAEIDPAEYEAVVESLAAHLLDHYGAPDRSAALAAAREEAEFAAGLCTHPVNTLLAVERDLEDRGIVERFRAIEPRRAADHARIWEIDPEGTDA